MNSTKHTKIVATLGPASDSPEKIAELIRAGVNVFRFNMKHADIAWHNERISRVQKVADELRATIGILIDLQGPEIRIETPNKQDIIVQKGSEIVFSPLSPEEIAHHKTLSAIKDVYVYVPHPIIFASLNIGDSLLIDDGFLEFLITKKDSNGVTAQAVDDCVVKHRKGLNLLGKDIDLPSLIEDDLKKLDMAAKTKVDFVALSFSRTKKDIQVLRTEMEKRKINAMIVAKIESQAALDHLDEIIAETDAVMVARGDLGIEVPIEQLAHWQKTMIAKCRIAHKPVITATQMLESMIVNPRPTRAEAVDVANAVFDGTDAVMLSAESANGKWPTKAVAAMAKIAAYNEQYTTFATNAIPSTNTTDVVVQAAQKMMAEHEIMKLDAVLVFTETGYTARAVSSLRSNLPIIAVTDNKKTAETLTLSYGVSPVYTTFPSGTIQTTNDILEKLKKMNVVYAGQSLLIIHGTQWGIAGLTNRVTVMKVE